MTSTFLLDARSLAPSGDDGAGRIVRALVRDLSGELSPRERIIVLARPESVETLRLLGGSTCTVVPSAIPSASIRQHVGLSATIADLAPDVFVYPQFDLPLIPRRVRGLAAVFDLTPLREPGYFGRGRGLRRLAAWALLASTAARAARVVTISNAVARDLAAHGVANAVVHLPGIPDMPRVDVPRRPKQLLYVGNFRPHKRVPLLLRAFARARARDPALSLLIAGRADPRFPEVPELLQGPLGAGVRWRAGTSDDELAELYASSVCLVFPSVGEGFGFPVVEAFAMGTPAIVADAGALPEVVGRAGLVVRADDEDALANAMVQVGSDAALVTRLRDAIPNELSRFSWSRHARQWLETMRAVRREPPR